jgi:NitT/TauT family transport system substrate-binding protein
MTTRISRRALLAGAASFAPLLGGCVSKGGVPGVLRIGFLANLSHAPMLAGIGSGRFAKAVAPLKLEAHVFRAGPRVLEALIGRAIDIGTSGPAPIVFTNARHGDGAIRVLTGCASGGASFVVAKASGIRVPQDIRKKSIAVTQLGSTQDIALRKYLRTHGLETTEKGGDVRILALAPSEIRTQMIRGELDGGWLPEPWGTRLIAELGATRFVDERDLWPNRAFASAVAITRPDFLEARANDVKTMTRAIEAEVERALHDPKSVKDETYEEIKRQTGNPGPRSIFEEAWKFVDYTRDVIAPSITTFANDAAALGLIKASSCSRLLANVTLT